MSDALNSVLPFRVIPGERDEVMEPDQRSPEYSDDALALRFAERHEEDRRYVAAWSRWMLWNGQRWLEDATVSTFDLVRTVCREASNECDERQGRALVSATTIAAVERLAKSDRRLAATVDQWDSDPWLLNTPGGVIDLRTAETMPHRATAYMTHITSVGPDGDCPTWLAYLDRVTGGDKNLATFLQTVVGYSLTGITTEHALFFLFGHGANGKSVFTTTVAGILGDYHRTSAIETFTTTAQEQHATGLARLQGARLVTSIETEEGRHWAESRVKALTGGDVIAARFMRQDFFEFTPQFKLMFAGNHKPQLRSVDEAIRRRFHLIPFTVTIPPEERDPGLVEKLRHEWPGILAWMIEGCTIWQERGLAQPTAVADATLDYLQSEDSFAAWIEDCCIRDPNAWELSAKLFASWSSWATKAGETIGNNKRFARALEGRGIQRAPRRDGRGFVGLRVAGDAP